MISKDISKKLKADFIICGATGFNAVERFLIGSVSENIVRSAKCDVLVIRTPRRIVLNKIKSYLKKRVVPLFLGQLFFMKPLFDL